MRTTASTPARTSPLPAMRTSAEAMTAYRAMPSSCETIRASAEATRGVSSPRVRDTSQRTVSNRLSCVVTVIG